MGNWRKVCTGLTVMILIAVLGISLFGSPATSWYLEHQVKQHLLADGLAEADILSTKATFQKGEQINYVIQVVFASEPEIVRYYYCNMDKEIQEMEHVSQ